MQRDGKCKALPWKGLYSFEYSIADSEKGFGSGLRHKSKGQGPSPALSDRDGWSSPALTRTHVYYYQNFLFFCRLLEVLSVWLGFGKLKKQLSVARKGTASRGNHSWVHFLQTISGICPSIPEISSLSTPEAAPTLLICHCPPEQAASATLRGILLHWWGRISKSPTRSLQLTSSPYLFILPFFLSFNPQM